MLTDVITFFFIRMPVSLTPTTGLASVQQRIVTVFHTWSSAREAVLR